MDANGNPTDQSLVHLAMSIKGEESGGDYTKSGDAGTSLGAYQWNNGSTPIQKGQLPANFVAGAKQFGLDPTDFSQENQNKVAYLQMAQMKDKGLQPYEIASSWNSGSPDNWQNHSGTATINGQQVKYDTPTYVKNVMAKFTKLQGSASQGTQDQGQPQDQNAPTDPLGGKSFSELYGGSPAGGSAGGTNQPGDVPGAITNAFGSGTAFPATAGDSASTSALKTAGNLIPSAFSFGKGVLSSLNPLKIIDTISQIPGAWEDALNAHGGDIGATLKDLGSSLLPTTYDQLVPQFGKDLVAGNTEAAQADVENNPVGSIAPFIFAGEAGAEGIDKVTGASASDAAAAEAAKANGEEAPARTGATGAIDRTMSKIAAPVTDSVSSIASKAAGATGSIAKYIFGQATGLDPKTISTVIDNPDEFSKANAGNITRDNLGGQVGDALNTRIDNLNESGAGYNDIRSSKTPVTVDPEFLQTQIEKAAGVTVDPETGTIEAPAGSKISNPGDVSRLENFYKRWQPEFQSGEMTPDKFLTMRQELSDITYNDSGVKSGNMAKVTEQLRTSLNTEYRPQIDGLEEKDADYSSQAQELKNLRKGIIDKDGNLTDGAVNKISNAVGKGKSALLERLEEISPGITGKIKILKAAEDLEAAAGTKVGTYTRSVLGAGGLIGGLTTMNLPVIAASLGEMVLSNPDNAVAILRMYGKSAELMRAVAAYVKTGGAAINNLPKTLGAPAASVFGRSATPSLQ